MNMRSRFLLGLASVLALAGGAQAFEYVGLGVGVEPSTLLERFPESRHEFWQRGSGSIARPEDGDGRFAEWLKDGDGLYIVKLSADDSRGDVTAISVSLDRGKVRRWIFSFERAGTGTRPEQNEKRYPGCKRVLDSLAQRYGEPGKFTTRIEEGLQHRARVWTSGQGEMILDCGRYPNRPTIFAIDLEISPR